MLPKLSGERGAYPICKGRDTDKQSYSPEELTDEFADDFCFGGGRFADFIFDSVFEPLCIF
jgi:hypothetical protein